MRHTKSHCWVCNVNVHSEVAGGRGSLLNVALFDEAVPRPEALLPAVRVGPVPLEWATRGRRGECGAAWGGLSRCVRRGGRRGAEAARAPAPAGAPHTSPVKSQWFRCIPTPATVRQPLMIARGVSAASGIRCPYVCREREARTSAGSGRPRAAKTKRNRRAHTRRGRRSAAEVDRPRRKQGREEECALALKHRCTDRSRFKATRAPPQPPTPRNKCTQSR